jgi:hypothetical protein
MVKGKFINFVDTDESIINLHLIQAQHDIELFLYPSRVHIGTFNI